MIIFKTLCLLKFLIFRKSLELTVRLVEGASATITHRVHGTRNDNHIAPQQRVPRPYNNTNYGYCDSRKRYSKKELLYTLFISFNSKYER